MTAANTDVRISDTMSEDLVAMIDIWVTGFVTVTELPRKIMEKALKEGFDKETIR